MRSLLHRSWVQPPVVVGLHHITMRAVATQPQVVSLSRTRRIARRASGIPRVAAVSVSASARREDRTTPSGQVEARRDPTRAWRAAGVALAAAATLSAAAAPIAFAEREFYIEDIPQGLSSGDGGEKAPSLRSLVKGTNTKEIEKCTGKCVVTCTRGGEALRGSDLCPCAKRLWCSRKDSGAGSTASASARRYAASPSGMEVDPGDECGER